MEKTNVKYYDDGPYLRSFKRRLIHVEEPVVRRRRRCVRPDLLLHVTFMPLPQQSVAPAPVRLLIGPREAFEVKRLPTFGS